jgi:hypothetical protein
MQKIEMGSFSALIIAETKCINGNLAFLIGIEIDIGSGNDLKKSLGCSRLFKLEVLVKLTFQEKCNAETLVCNSDLWPFLHAFVR